MQSRRPLRALIVLATLAGPATVRAQQLDSPSDMSAKRGPLAIASYSTTTYTLAPCVPSRTPAASRDRPVVERWAARVVVAESRPGWTVVIDDLDEKRRWGYPISDRDSTFDTPVIRSSRVRITLLRTSSEATGDCPVVNVHELHPSSQGTPRGIFDSDDRWSERSSDLSRQNDAGAILGWLGPLVRLEVINDAGQLLPCTGFHLSPHLLMTASHCVMSASDLRRSTLFRSEREIAGSDADLLMVQGDLDFSLAWIREPTAATPLKLRAETPSDLPLVVWQFPHDIGKSVSIRGCEVATASDPLQLVHRCDTSVGSSGSPIQARTSGQVVALHTDGCTSTSGTSWCRNAGTRMSLILQRLEQLLALLRAAHPAAAAELELALK